MTKNTNKGTKKKCLSIAKARKQREREACQRRISSEKKKLRSSFKKDKEEVKLTDPFEGMEGFEPWVPSPPKVMFHLPDISTPTWPIPERQGEYKYKDRYEKRTGKIQKKKNVNSNIFTHSPSIDDTQRRLGADLEQEESNYQQSSPIKLNCSDECQQQNKQKSSGFKSAENIGTNLSHDSGDCAKDSSWGEDDDTPWYCRLE